MIVPRGRISHTLVQSIKYCFWSIFSSLTDAKKIDRLENSFSKYIGTEFCIAFPHARTALYHLLKEMNLPAGSKIVMPAMTIKFILDVVVSLDLKPVYIDYDMETYSFDISKLDSIKDRDIKVMLVTPIFGVVPNMLQIKGFCEKQNIFLIEDFSQCLNGKILDKKIGTFGKASIYSASSIKTLDTLGGGMLVTSSKDIYTNLKKEQEEMPPPSRFLLLKRAIINLIRNLATNPLLFNLFTIHMIKILALKNKENALRQTGTRDKTRLSKLPKEWFYSYSSVQARIALENINKVIDNDNKRIEFANFYFDKIGSKHFAQGAKNATNVYWQLPIKTNDSKAFHESLRSQGVDSALTSLQLISSLDNYPGHIHLPIAEKIFNNGLFIPCYAQLKKSNLKKVSNACINIINNFSN